MDLIIINHSLINKIIFKVVLKLTEKFAFTYRSITTDNFFTSISLAQDLFTIGLYLTGTLNKKKPQIPYEFLPNAVYCIKILHDLIYFLFKLNLFSLKTRPINSSEFGFNDYLTIVSFVPTQKRSVVLLSTCHHEKELVNDNDKHRPKIIEHYNINKSKL